MNERAANLLCVNAIFEYLEKDCLDKFQEKRDNIKKEYQEIIRNQDLESELKTIIEKLS